MKKKILLVILLLAVLIAVFVIPIPKGPYRDGGTREYAALTYKIVKWKRLTDDGVYEKTRVYFLDECYKSIDELWENEAKDVVNSFTSKVIEITSDTVIVEPLENEIERSSSDRISFGTDGLEDIGVSVGSYVKVGYLGEIRESYPASVTATEWELATDLRNIEYTGQWLDKENAVEYSDDVFSDIIITEIYSDCFFAMPVIPMPYMIKLNGTLSDEWCVGDQIITKHENVYYDQSNHRIEADLLTVEVSDFEIDPEACYKPVIYLYPEEETEVLVKLSLNGELTCTYPEYNNGWSVTAKPDGTLTDGEGMTYNYLYWEGETYANYDLSKGFCVRGEDTAEFLEDALCKLGLTRREANEFIVYWLPLMEQNRYNIISFQTDAYTDAAELDILPEPDTLIRVFMTWQAVDEYIDISAQELKAPERDGFTVVEWGGTELKK